MFQILNQYNCNAMQLLFEKRLQQQSKLQLQYLAFSVTTVVTIKYSNQIEADHDLLYMLPQQRQS